MKEKLNIILDENGKSKLYEEKANIKDIKQNILETTTQQLQQQPQPSTSLAAAAAEAASSSVCDSNRKAFNSLAYNDDNIPSTSTNSNSSSITFPSTSSSSNSPSNAEE